MDLRGLGWVRRVHERCPRIIGVGVYAGDRCFAEIVGRQPGIPVKY